MNGPVEIRGAHRFGIQAEVREVDWNFITRRVNDSIDAEPQEIEAGNRDLPNVTVFREAARFLEGKTLDVGGTTIRSDTIVIAAGTRPQVPDIPGLADVPHLTSDDAMRLTKQPRSLASGRDRSMLDAYDGRRLKRHCSWRVPDIVVVMGDMSSPRKH